MKQQLLKMYGMTLGQAQKLAADVPCERCAEVPFDGAKHPAWVLSHLSLAGDMLLQMLENPDVAEPGLAMCPAAWADAAMPGKPVSADRQVFASKAELLSMLDDVHAKLAAKVEASSETLMATALANEGYRDFFPTLGDATFYMLAYHEGYHLGQLSSWRRAVGFSALPE